MAIYQAFKLIKNNTTTIGFDYKNFGGKAQNILAMGGKGIVFGDTTITEWAPYLFSQQTVAQKLILSAGFRLENNNAYGSIPVPSTGISYLATNTTTVKGAVSKGFRSPTVQELYLFPPANAKLQPEKMVNYEATLHQRLYKNKIDAELTLFHVKGNNLIQTVFRDGVPRNFNSGEFANTGLEFSAKYKANSTFNFATNYSFTKVKQPILAVPTHQVFLTGNANIKKLALNINLQHISGLYSQAEPTAKQSNYTLMNAKAGYSFNRYLDIFVKGENLTNQKYEINAGYPMPGITVFGGLNFHLSK